MNTIAKFLFFTGILISVSVFSAITTKADGITEQNPAVKGGQLFVLGPGDEMEITVLGYPELSTKAVVFPDGYISLPFIGSLKAEGLNSQTLTETIQKDLDSYVYNPEVSISLLEMRSKRFSVLGDVRMPGTFPLWDKDITIYEAISQAQGFLPTAYLQQVRVMRENGFGQKMLINLDLTEQSMAQSDVGAFKLRSGDVVYIPSRLDKPQVCILGKVTLPGRYNLTQGMTIIDALAAAGWITKEGVSSSVVLARLHDGKRELSRIDTQAVIFKHDESQDIQLQPGDIVYVPEKFIYQLTDFVGYFSSNVEPAANAYLDAYNVGKPAYDVINR